MVSVFRIRLASGESPANPIRLLWINLMSEQTIEKRAIDLSKYISYRYAVRHQDWREILSTVYLAILDSLKKGHTTRVNLVTHAILKVIDQYRMWEKSRRKVQVIPISDVTGIENLDE